MKKYIFFVTYNNTPIAKGNWQEMVDYRNHLFEALPYTERRKIKLEQELIEEKE